MADLFDTMMAYEQDGLSEDEMVEFFQQLVDTGMAWKLQGSYGRSATALIEAGLVIVPGSTDEEAEYRQ